MMSQLPSPDAPKSANDLCQHLALILRQEIAVGNSVSYTEQAFIDSNGVLVMLASSFKSIPRVESPVKFIRVNDPHMWDAEYRCAEHSHQLVCPIELLPLK
jgi:hypothetical protein